MLHQSIDWLDWNQSTSRLTSSLYDGNENFVKAIIKRRTSSYSSSSAIIPVPNHLIRIFSTFTGLAGLNNLTFSMPRMITYVFEWLLGGLVVAAVKKSFGTCNGQRKSAVFGRQIKKRPENNLLHLHSKSLLCKSRAKYYYYWRM